MRHAKLAQQTRPLTALVLVLVPVVLFNVSAGAVPVCLTVALLKVGSASSLGLLGVRYVPLAIVILFGGVSSQFVNRRFLLRWSLAATAVAQGICAMAFSEHGLQVWPLLVGLTGSGLAAGFIYPAFAAEIATRGEGPRLRTFNSAYRVGTTVGTAAGAAVGGALLALLGVTHALIVCATLVAGAMIVGECGRSSTNPMPPLRQFRLKGTWQALSRRWFLATLIFTGGINVLWTAIFSVSLPVLMGASGRGALLWSWVLTANSAGFAFGGVIAGIIRPRMPLRYAALSLLGASVLLALFSASTGVVGLCLSIAFATGLVVEQVNLNVVQTQQERGRDIGAGLVASADLLAGILTSPAGFLLGGLVVVSIGGGNGTVFLSGGIAAIAIVFLLIRPWRRMARMGVAASS